MRFLLVFLMLTSLGSAQIELSYEIRKSLVGATNAELLPGGRQLIDADSRISVSDLAVVKVASSEGVRIIVQQGGKDFVGLEVYKSSVDADSKISTSWYLLIGGGTYDVHAISRTNEAWDRKLQVTIGPAPPVPDPEPKPPVPPGPPGPLTSFRVILVKESGSTLSAEQTAIPGAKLVRDYLTNKTTPEGGKAGWREYDPQQNVTNEQSKIKEMWLIAKSSITTVPCLIVERNGKIDVLPYPKNVAEAIKTLKIYGGE